MQPQSFLKHANLMHISLLLTIFLSPVLFANQAELLAAKRAYDEVNYELCLEKSTASLKTKALLVERAQAYKLNGLCASALGDDELASEMLSLWLAVDPKASLAENSSPRLSSAFLEAKGVWLDGEALNLEIKDDVLDEGERVLTLVISDLTDLVYSVQAIDDEGEVQIPVRSAARMEMSVPDYIQSLVLLDEFDGVLFELRLDEKNPANAIAAPKKETRIVKKNESSDESPPLLWAGVGVGTLVILGASVGAATFLLLSPADLALSSGVSFAPTSR